MTRQKVTLRFGYRHGRAAVGISPQETAEVEMIYNRYADRVMLRRVECDGGGIPSRTDVEKQTDSILLPRRDRERESGVNEKIHVCL